MDHHESTIMSVARGGRLADDAPPGQLIGGSWKRCLEDYGLDPGRIAVDVLTHRELAEHRDHIGEVIDIARAEMENLAAQIAGSGYALLLTNAEGVILCHQAEAALESNFRQAGLWDGADWSESRQGTNGIGTALIERRAVTVHCNDHFATRHTSLSCSAAPIHAPAGELLGVLDASSVQCEDSRASQMHTVALVSMSARLIEKCVFLNTYRDETVLRFHGRPEFVNLVHDGMLAVNGEGRVVAADDSAAMQLGYDDRDALVGKEISQFFDVTPSLLAQRVSEGNLTVWPIREVRRGRRYFACVRAPGRSTAGGRSAASTGRGSRLSARGYRRETVRPTLDDLQGQDPRMAFNVRCARRVVDKGVQLMIHGETGTGKEAFARAVHEAGARAEQPFVAVNCAAIPESLIESELFGYKAGAFTGARRDGMRGKILQSSGGTLFLDEIGDMPVELQTRLLRVLEEREVVPLGSEVAVPVDLNLISATHAPLKTMLADGRFREDLYYRLNGITLTLPPVRERADRDALLRAILADEAGEETVEMDEAAVGALMAYHWPGNIREMRNVLRTAVALCDEGVIRLADLPGDIGEMSGLALPVSAEQAATDTNGQTPPVAANPLECAERDAVMRALQQNRWNITNTARQLAMSRNTLYRKMKKHDIALSSGR
ncbi:MAG: sigma-54-dependent Fis family transcriptional regulator [Phycisphaerales bacterium]